MTTNPRVEHVLDQTPASPTDDDLVVTSCVDHGVKVTNDMPSFLRYVDLALEHRRAGDHDDDPGLECWVCCPAMVIDPAGITDEV